MPTPQFIETFKSGGGSESIDSPTAFKKGVVIDTFDDAVVRNVIESSLTPSYLGLSLSDYDFDPLGNGLWDVTATYGTKKLSNLGEVETSFDTTGGTRHITQSLATVGAYGTGAAVTDFGGAIGVDGDKVNGVDIPGPATFTFQLTKSWPFALMDQAKIVAISGMTFKTNTDIFYQFAAGTLLFLGASGSKRGFKDWKVTYQFGFSPNVTGLSVGGISGIAKKGWEYLWFAYNPSVNAAATRRVIKPYAAYVERVCEQAAFSTLGV
jgi:hypothetical protein